MLKSHEVATIDAPLHIFGEETVFVFEKLGHVKQCGENENESQAKVRTLKMK